MRLKRRLPWSSHGFTLLELLVAFAILTMGILAVLRTVSSGLLSARRAGDRTTAVMLAQRQLEELRWNDELQTNGESEGDFGELFPEYSWAATMEAAELADLEEADLERVTLTVKWKFGAKEHSLQVETLMRDSDFESTTEEEAF